MDSDNRTGSRPWRRMAAATARTRIMAWVVLLVMTALGVVTLVTWRVLTAAADERMNLALNSQVATFTEFTGSNRNPVTGKPFSSVEEMIKEAILNHVTRLNEYFLGYIDGVFYDQCRCFADAHPEIAQQGQAAETLADDQAFTERVGSVTKEETGLYHQPQLGEVRYLALPVTLDGDPSKGVIVAAFLADDERAEADKAAQVMLVVGAITMLLAAVAAWLLAGRILRPLHDVSQTARSITDSDLSRRIPRRVNRGDDLDRLVETINGMLDRIESAVDAQRRFIDDAAHELRTPITIVRGHLEVLDATDPDDIQDTVDLLDDELERMNRMVSDLLLLARAEQPSFLQSRAVDVGVLTREVFDKISRLGDRDFHLESIAETTCVLDPQRITQALVALCDNACRYTHAGNRISLGSRLDDGRLRFWVADSGPGVSDDDRARIFNRFARGSAGAARSEGAGLGLSIVAAIANAHGGYVDLDSAPGAGARFTLVIPAQVAPAQDEPPWPES